MAAGLLIFAEGMGADSILDRIEIYREGHAGGSIEVKGAYPFIEESYGYESEDIDTPIRDSQHICYLLPLDNNGDLIASALADLQAIRQSTDSREYILVHKRGGSEHWRGYVLARHVRTALHDGRQMVVLTAKDRSKSLEKQDFKSPTGLYTAHKKARELIGTLLESTGHSLNIVDESTAKPSAESGDPLDTYIPQERFWNYEADKDQVTLASKAVVLKNVFRAFMLNLVQWAGFWQLCFPASHLFEGTLTRREYSSDGATLNGTTTPVSYVDIDSVNWIHQTDESTGTNTVYRAEITYDIGRFMLGRVRNGQFGLWSGDQALEWTYSAAESNYKRFPGIRGAGESFGVNLHSLGILGAVTPLSEDPTLSEKKSFATIWASQEFGQFTSGDTDVRISWWHLIQTLYEYTEAIREQAFVRIKLTNGASTYYWVRSTEHAGTFQIVTGDAAIHPITEESLNTAPQQDWIEITNFPITGTVSFEMGQVVRGDIDHKSGDTDIYITYDGITLDRESSENTGEEAVTYVVEDTSLAEGDVVEETILIGDGPFAGAEGAMRLSDNATLTGSWKRRSTASPVAHTQMLSLEAISSKRASRRTLRLTSTEPVAGLSPVNAIRFGGDYYWPVYMHIERPSGITTVYAVELLFDDASLTSSNKRAASRGVLVGSRGGAAIYTALDGRITNTALREKTTEITATIDAGIRTSMTINPVQGSVFKDGEVIALEDVVTGEIYYLRLTADYTAGGSTLSFEDPENPGTGYNFDHPVKVGSYVFADSPATKVRVAITENVVRQVVIAGELCKVTETLSGVNRTSITVDGLNYDIKNDNRFNLIRSDGGDAIGLVATSDQSATAGILYFDNGSGGSVNITCQSGDSIVYDGAFVGSSISQSATSIEAEVQARHEFEAIGLLNGGYSGSRSTLSIKTPGLKLALRTGTKLMVGDLMANNWVEIELSQDHSASATTLHIVNKDIGMLSDGDVVKIPDYASSGLARILQDEINLRVLKTDFDARLVGKTLGLLSSSLSGNNKTQMSVKSAKADGGTGADMELPTDTPLAVTNPSNGDTAIVWTNEEVSKGESTINIYDGEGTNVDIISARTGLGITLPVDSVVSVYNGHPNISKTAINLFLDSIQMDTNLIWVKTNAEIKNDEFSSWDWKIDEDGFFLKSTPGGVFQADRSYAVVQADGDMVGGLWGTDSSLILTTDISGGAGTGGVLISAKSGGKVQVNAAGGGSLEVDSSPSRVYVDGKLQVASGDFVVDTDTLFVDFLNDRVGINDSTPSYDLDVNGDVQITGNVVCSKLPVFQSKSSGSYSPSFDRRVKFTIDGIDVYLYGVDAP